MQTSATAAASLNPFAAAQAGGQAVGGLEGLLEGLFGGGEDGGETTAVDAFSEALAAALVMPTPAQPIQAAPVAKTGDVPAPAIAAAAGAQGFMISTPVVAEQVPAATDPKACAPAGAAAITTEGGIALPDAAAQGSTETSPDTSGQSNAPDLKLALAAARDTVAPQAIAQVSTAAPASQPVAPPSMVAPAAVIAQTPVIAEAAKTEAPPAVQADAAVQLAAPRSASGAAPAEPNAKTSPKTKAAAAAGETRGDLKAAAAPASPAAPSLDAPNDAPLASHDGADAELAPLSDAPAGHDEAAGPTLPVTGHHEMRASAPAIETPRATSQTVAHLAAQITSKIDGKSTRFDVQLDPHGLGKVDVKVEIAANGSVSAALSFENPQAAAELRGRQGELQAALEQAGFDLSKTSLSFSSGGQGQQGLFDQQQQQQAQTPVWRGRAFTDLSDTPETAPSPVRRAATGVDVRI